MKGRPSIGEALEVERGLGIKKKAQTGEVAMPGGLDQGGLASMVDIVKAGAGGQKGFDGIFRAGACRCDERRRAIGIARAQASSGSDQPADFDGIIQVDGEEKREVQGLVVGHGVQRDRGLWKSSHSGISRAIASQAIEAPAAKRRKSSWPHSLNNLFEGDGWAPRALGYDFHQASKSGRAAGLSCRIEHK